MDNTFTQQKKHKEELHLHLPQAISFFVSSMACSSLSVQAFLVLTPQPGTTKDKHPLLLSSPKDMGLAGLMIPAKCFIQKPYNYMTSLLTHIHGWPNQIISSRQKQMKALPHHSHWKTNYCWCHNDDWCTVCICKLIHACMYFSNFGNAKRSRYRHLEGQPSKSSPMNDFLSVPKMERWLKESKSITMVTHSW